MSVLRGYLLQLKDNGVWNAFLNSKALPKQKVSYCEVSYIDGKVPAEDDFNLVSLALLLISHNRVFFPN